MRRAWWLSAVAAGLLTLAAAPVHAATRALVVAGLGGTPEYETAFQRHAKHTADALREVADDVTLLLGDMTTHVRLRDELAALGTRSSADDALLLVLIGHGTYDERDYRFNVPGPDVTGAELAAWLQAVPVRRQLVVAATSASGALQPLLSRDGRALITATRSGGESNASVFGRYFSEALTAAAADTDKDGYVGAAEAFAFAEAGVAGYYDERREMATEHPQLTGRADVPLARVADTEPFAVAGAEAQRLEALEAAVADLRARKDQMPADAYYAELQRLMLDVAVERRGAAAPRGAEGRGAGGTP